MAVGFRIAGVQPFHGLVSRLTAAQGHAHPVVHTQVVALNGGQPFMDERIDAFVLLPEN